MMFVQGMLNHLKDKKDVGFFTSIAGLMNSCSVLDLDAFERNTKAEGKNMTFFRLLPQKRNYKVALVHTYNSQSSLARSIV